MRIFLLSEQRLLFLYDKQQTRNPSFLTENGASACELRSTVLRIYAYEKIFGSNLSFRCLDNSKHLWLNCHFHC